MCLVSMNNLHFVDKEGWEKIEEICIDFATWLFKRYLFDLEIPHEHIRNKSIRKVCYDILQSVSEYQPKFGEFLAEAISEIGIEPRNK